MANEGYIQKKTVDYLKKLELQKILHYERRNAVGGAYRSGLPDIWFVTNTGKHCEMEMKDINGSTRTHQYVWRDIFKSINVPYCKPRTLEEAINFINTQIGLKS